jgi:enoyl-CoA hydratase
MNDAQPDKPCAAQAEPTDALVIEERERVAIVRFNRPAARNSLSSQTLDELDAVVAALATRQSIAGADIRELRALMPDAALAFARRGQALMQQIAAAPQLTIAAVNGYCMGGGLDLALACDLRCAAPAAVFAHPGARLGIITGWGGTQRLPRLIGQARALEMLLTGRRVSGEEALALGLVNRVGTPVLDCALELAARRV